jgi:hypothetical protein
VTRRAGGGGPNVGVGRKDETLLHVRDLACQCIGDIPLALPSEGSRTYMSLALCSRGTSSNEGGGEGGVRTTDVEVGLGRWRWCREHSGGSRCNRTVQIIRAQVQKQSPK